MANMYINNMTALWNSGGTDYSAIKMNVTVAASSGTSKLLDLQTGSVPRFTVDKVGNVMLTGIINTVGLSSSAALKPSANDSASLGTSDTAWSDLFLASGALINWNAGDVTITHAANMLTFGGAGLGYLFDGVVKPAANDVAALGTVTEGWSDLFLASGSVVDFAAGDITVTHVADADLPPVTVLSLSNTNPAVCTVAPGDIGKFSNGMTVLIAGAAGTGMTAANGSRVISNVGFSNVGAPTNTFTLVGVDCSTGLGPQITGVTADPPFVSALTVGGGDLRVTTPGAHPASAVTTAAQQTLTNKTLTSPIMSNAAIAGITVTAGGSLTGTFAGGTFTGTTLTAPTITSPTVSEGTFTGTMSIGTLNASGPISSANNISANASFVGNANTAVLACGSSGTVYLRPNGYNNATGQMTVATDGDVSASGQINAKGLLTCQAASGNVHLWFYGPSGQDRMVLYCDSTSAGHTYLRVNGTYAYMFGNDGGTRWNFYHATQGATQTYSYYNGPNGPSGSAHGALLYGNGTASTCAGYFITYNGSTSYCLLGFHHPGVAYWAIYSVGPAVTSSAWQVSDVKIKSEIQHCDCEDAHRKMRAIPVKAYRKDDGMFSRRHVGFDEMGFLAHEIEAVFPEAVMEVSVPVPDVDGKPQESKETRKITNDRSLLANLWAAVQHQAGMIDRLEAKLKALERK